jgi:hypothetical protein
MAELSNGNEFGKAVCEMLGVDPALVKGLHISLEANELIHVQVDFIPSFKNKEQIDKAIKLLCESAKEVWAQVAIEPIDTTSLADKYRACEAQPWQAVPVKSEVE